MDTKTISLQLLHAINQKLDNLGIALLANKTVFNFEEVVKYTGLSKSYIYKLSCAGLIPHSKPNGKQLYFSKQQIDEWLMRNGVRTNDSLEQEAINYVTLKKNRR